MNAPRTYTAAYRDAQGFWQPLGSPSTRADAEAIASKAKYTYRVVRVSWTPFASRKDGAFLYWKDGREVSNHRARILWNRR